MSHLLSKTVNLSSMDEKLRSKLSEEINYRLFGASVEVKIKKARAVNYGAKESDQAEVPIL